MTSRLIGCDVIEESLQRLVELVNGPRTIQVKDIVLEFCTVSLRSGSWLGLIVVCIIVVVVGPCGGLSIVSSTTGCVLGLYG